MADLIYYVLLALALAAAFAAGWVGRGQHDRLELEKLKRQVFRLEVLLEGVKRHQRWASEELGKQRARVS